MYYCPHWLNIIRVVPGSPCKPQEANHLLIHNKKYFIFYTNLNTSKYCSYSIITLLSTYLLSQLILYVEISSVIFHQQLFEDSEFFSFFQIFCFCFCASPKKYYLEVSLQQFSEDHCLWDHQTWGSCMQSMYCNTLNNLRSLQLPFYVTILLNSNRTDT